MSYMSGVSTNRLDPLKIKNKSKTTQESEN